MMGCHQRATHIFVLVFMLVIPNVLGQCTSPFEDISSDPLQVRCVYVSPTTATPVNFAEARHACQALDPTADLIKILGNDIADLVSHSNYDSSSTYYVGLTNAAIASNRENVIDCSAYNPLIQALLSSDTCLSAQCNCWALDSQNGILDQKSCLTDQHLYICGLTNSEDYVDVICPNGWEKVKDRCYRYHTGESTVATFTQAQDMCAVDCGSLARVNFYDCNYAGILGARSNTGTSYLVGLMGSSGTEEWRDNSMPDTNLIYTTGAGTGDCFVLKDDGSTGALERVSCTDGTATQNFICERESLIPTTPGIQTTVDEGATTQVQVTTREEATTQVELTTNNGVVTTGNVETTAIREASTAVGEVTTGEGEETTTSVDARVSTNSVLGFDRNDPCNPNPCEGTGTGEITCVATSASVAHCVCSTGFELESLLGPCFDINECDRNLHNCSTTEACVNNEGSFTCECTSCNQPDTGNQGVDVCANSNGNPCDVSTTRCQSTGNGYTCECLGARVRVNDRSCTDQCTAGSHGCDIATTICVADNEGIATCECRTGYQSIPENPNACQLNSGLSARMRVRVTSIGGIIAIFTELLEDKTSFQFREIGHQICDAITLKLEDTSQCRPAGFDAGSIVAYLQVTIPIPNKIRGYEHMKDVLIDGSLNDEGYATLYTSDGKEVIIDPNALEVDDIANYVCRPSTCQNGGVCSYEDRFIQTHCQCTEGFQGRSCDTIMVSEPSSSSTGLLIGLTLLVVVLFIAFFCCFCVICVLSRRRLQTENKKIFRYQPPVAMPPSQSSGLHEIQRISCEASAKANGQSYSPVTFPRIIRNRAVDQGMEMHSRTNENYGYQSADYDVESVLDNRRMEHYKKFFSNSRELNSHMSSRGDGSSSTGSVSLKPTVSHLGDHDFYRPYTVDGTENT
ncbi:Matrilin-3 [Holothuria leucospilota]|uniref:Matrilin-3 n=1 Tax=Holothuria leucospilota TaxID=206669 RepID=A0A9Q1C0U2_HOLLE|nr:Matrilin-3 [Holothuria leucospilota]